METVQEADKEGEEEKGGGEKEKGTMEAMAGATRVVREQGGIDGSLEDAVEEEESVDVRKKVDSELISNNVALVHLLKGNIGIGVMAMPRYF